MKIYVTHCKLAGNHFAIQFRWKQRNSTANETKHVFAIKLKEAYFKHRKGKTLFFVTQSSNQPKFAANKPNDVIDKLERQKGISCKEKWQRLLEDNAENSVT